MDPPPTTEPMGPPAAAPPPPHSAYAANPTPTHPPVHNHPPYAEMITAAIAALNERTGSSKKAIFKYIESHYSNLPPTHSALLSHHLKRLKNNGQILMVKYSYKLPKSGIAPPVSANGAVSNSVGSVGPKKRPGRPPKPKSVQAPIPVFAQTAVPISDAPAVVPVTAELQNAVGSVYVAVGPTRGRGRPPKSGVMQSGVGRGRGRPKKIVAPPASRVKRLGKSRGRPRKVSSTQGGVVAVGGGTVGPVSAGGDVDGALPVSGGGIVQEAGKRRGRPRKDGAEAKRPRNVAAGDPKKPLKLGGKPLGRPKKNASAVTSQTPDSQLLMAYLDLKGKLEDFQSRIKQTTSIIKPYLNNEIAVNALQELETLAIMNISESNVQPPLNLGPKSLEYSNLSANAKCS